MKKNNFLERSIFSALSFFRESVFSEEIALRHGLLQSIEPRLKAAAFAAVILCILFLKSIAPLLFLYSFCLLLARLSKIRLGFFLKRTLFFIPLFSLFIALPAFFSNFSGAALFVARVLTSVSFVILLGLATRQNELLRCLRNFGVPQIFVMVMGMSYRYLYILIKISEDTCVAIKSRSGFRMHYRRGQSIAAAGIASLWQRSQQLSQGAYSAMLSRGFSGEPRVLEEPKIFPRDIIFFCAMLVVCALAAYSNFL